MQTTIQPFQIKRSSIFRSMAARVLVVADRVATAVLVRYSSTHREAANICQTTLQRNLWRVRMDEVCDAMSDADKPTANMLFAITKAQYGNQFLDTAAGRKAILERLEAAFPSIRFPAAPQ